MGLLKKVVILFVLQAALILPISASGDMIGSGQGSGGSMSSETGGTIVVEFSGGDLGGDSGGYYPGSQGGFTNGYGSSTSRGITIGTNNPLAGPTYPGNPSDPDSVTSGILNGIDGLGQDLRNKYSDYNRGTLSADEFANYCNNLDWNLKNIKGALDSLQGLVTAAKDPKSTTGGEGRKDPKSTTPAVATLLPSGAVGQRIR